MNELFPPIDPYSSGFLEVDYLHTLYWEQCGNPDGVPIIYLHAGPGGALHPLFRQFFDPDFFRIILFDQRGCGRSTPNMCLENNTRKDLIADIEKLRKHFNLDQWHVFGGSWGSTLALSYAIEHPESCLSLILRGIFLLSKEELDWFFYDMNNIFPEAYEAFLNFLPEKERKDPLKGYYKRLTGADHIEKEQAGLEWARYESACASIIPKTKEKPKNENQKKAAITLSTIEAHFFTNEIIPEEKAILKQLDKIKHIPTSIIQGRYDVICPIKTAHKLHKAWPEAKYTIVPDGGHSLLDPGILSALIDATESLKKDHKHEL